MADIEKIYSVSAVIGTGKCNANCPFCAGYYLRDDKCPPETYWKNYKTAIKLCARHGGWSLSLTSSGEPTCESEIVTRALQEYRDCTNRGAYMPVVNLFTNGILIANDDFAEQHLKLWKMLGLTHVAVSVHSPYVNKQAESYGIKSYPNLEDISSNIIEAGLSPRATLLLKKGDVDNLDLFLHTLDVLKKSGFSNVTCWPVVDPDGSRNDYTPSRWNLWRIKNWLDRNYNLAHRHEWGGGVYEYGGDIVRFTTYVTPYNPKKNYVRQLVVFPDGGVYYSWIREGSICLR